MIPTMTLIKKDDILKVNGSTSLYERIKNKDVDAEMKLDISVNPNKDLYKAFCIQRKKNPESSRLDFFHIDEFPDGVFLEQKEDGTYHCHVFELKYTGSRDLKKLTKQLFSGYVHCKTLLSVLDIDLNETSFSFHVVCAQENNKQTEYNMLVKGKKTITARPINNNTMFNNWLSNKLVYKIGDYSKILNIHKILLETEDDFTYSGILEF